ncbi:8-oxo-dGTP diphosphatase [Andreprevotia lacus DSM 23236]|jgi:8-oxo-dGTP diphosphatase|uniref:8-oxo-dGTP diphosphatase n=1 Tax=Andreprevotia lacus DSM 23236 TaxID=1121001 RepID=A0A1W1WWF3_9NEIS|nr:Nudix family hydrolase [Andreprevotia lacus]SMC16066.1 8-oxo-dGTP diphosphatase [Andreprevotia lacus DSM 23236]
MSTDKQVAVAAGILIDGDSRFLLGSRPAGKVYAGYWEFPGGKLEAGETPHDALCRELMEEMGIVTTAATPWIVQTFTYPHATVRLHFFRVTGWQGEPKPHEGQQFAWQQAGALNVSPILPANGPILRGLMLPDDMALSNAAGLGTAAWLDKLDQRLAAGLRWLILREPALDAAQYRALAETVIARCRSACCRVLLHGDIALARELGADGVQLPARIAAGLDRRPTGIDWLGVSAHSGTELAQAERIDADFALLGHVQATASHPGATPLGWDGFATLVGQGWPFPVYALGGMKDNDVATARQHGGHGIARLSGAWA